MSQAVKTLGYLLPWAVVIFLCSYYTPYFGNDYRYMLVEGTNDLVGSLSDIVISQYRHYFDWGGRTVNHLIAQFLLYIEKPWQSLITTATYLLLLLATVWAGLNCRYPTLKVRIWPLIFVSLVFWLCMRNFGEVVINVVSSCNYMFSTLIILLFLIPFCQSFHVEHDVRAWWVTPAMFVLGLLAGWTNENTGCAAVVVVGLYNLKLLWQRRLSAWQFSGGVGLLLGYLILMLAPGNEARMQFMENKGFDFWEHFFNDSLPIIGLSFLTQHLLLISLAYILWQLKRHALLVNPSAQVKMGLWLCAAGFISLLIMLASPTIPARSAAPFTIFVAAGTVALAQELYAHGISLWPKSMRNVVVGLLLIFSTACAVNAILGYRQLNFDNKQRGMEIIAQLRQGKHDLVVSPFKVERSRYIYVADVRVDPNNWANLILTRYYNLHSIVRSCDEPSRKLANDFIYFAKLGKPICTLKTTTSTPKP